MVLLASLPSHQLCDELLCELVLLHQSCVVLVARQHGCSLHDRPQHKQVGEIQILHAVPAWHTWSQPLQLE